MLDIKKLQAKIRQNKIDKGFDKTTIDKEFCLLSGELAEAYDAYNKKLPDLGEEFADVFIYLLDLCRSLDIDIEKEINQKVEKNSKREYTKNNKGVFVRTKEAPLNTNN